LGHNIGFPALSGVNDVACRTSLRDRAVVSGGMRGGAGARCSQALGANAQTVPRSSSAI